MSLILSFKYAIRLAYLEHLTSTVWATHACGQSKPLVHMLYWVKNLFLGRKFSNFQFKSVQATLTIAQSLIERASLNSKWKSLAWLSKSQDKVSSLLKFLTVTLKLL